MSLHRAITRRLDISEPRGQVGILAMIGHWTKDFEKKEAMLGFTEIHGPRRHPISQAVDFPLHFPQSDSYHKGKCDTKGCKDWLEWLDEH